MEPSSVVNTSLPPSFLSMVEARSVAVVGASPREGSFGWQMMHQLLEGGFAGEVRPINPSHDEVEGLPCLPSLDALPEPVDLVLLGVKNALLEEQLEAAARAGARSAVIFASCYEPPRAGVLPLPDRLAAIAQEAGMALCGGNCMGFINFAANLRACGFSEPEGLELGPIAFLSHSGSAFSALLHNDRGLRFSLVASVGTELVTTADQYLRYALERPETQAVAMFMETIRRPAEFRAALELAGARDVPVVALKVGREDWAKELVTAHSGALAGEDEAYQALFDAHGVLRVRTLDEMADTLELLVSGRRAAPGGLAAIHDSGGERALLIDAAAEAGVRLARISEQTTERLAAVLEEGLPPVNPLDAWGTGNAAEEIFIECMLALLDDPDTGALAFCIDLTTELVPEAGYTHVANEVFAKTDKPVAVLSNMASAIDGRDARFIRGRGIPILEGTSSGLGALRHLFEYRDFRTLGPVNLPEPVGEESRSTWAARLAAGGPLSEIEGLRLLRDYGIPVPRAEPAGSIEEVLAAGERVGWPVVLKTASPDLAHKTDVAGVKLGLREPEALGAAYEDIAGRLGPDVTVEAAATPGVELALGIVRDEQFGPLVMVAAGGVLVEVLRDTRFALPPLDPERARRLLDGLSVRTLLDGVRGAPPADVDAVAAALARLGLLATDLGEWIEALDVNPLIAGPDGCWAVDVLVVPRAADPAT
jgi:acetate---CoA ligase (ADP-forming)